MLRRLLPPALGAVLAIALLPGSFGLDSVAREAQLGPGFWPRLALIGLALACVAKGVEEWRRAPARGDGAGRSRAPMSRPVLGAAVALMVGYVALAPVLGFALTTALFAAAFLALGGTRSRATLAACAVGGTVALLFLFVKFVYLPLPKGDGPFETLTLALYRALRIF
jgi:putative tricarboxylic transport membrane protein